MKLNRYRGTEPPSNLVQIELKQAKNLTKQGQLVWIRLRYEGSPYEVLGIGTSYVYYGREGFSAPISPRHTYYKAS